MTLEQINEQLYRPLSKGKKYHSLMPNSSCSVVALAKGNTKIALREMAKWAKKHQWHTKKIAKHLLGRSIEQTAQKIQNFLYNHIQYSIDGVEQNLKSPACAWQTRYEGTDCKSYSIFASTILLNLGIKHYLRRIKQDPLLNAFTHVYVVIPYNQKNHRLNNNSQFGRDYTIIDGTIEYNNELDFVEKNDLYMEPALQINGLASPHQECSCATKDNTYQPYAMGSLLDNFPNIFGGWAPSCIGGTYDKNDASKFNMLVANAFDSMYFGINSVIRNLNESEIREKINEIYVSTQQLKDQTQYTASHGWKSKCSRDTTRTFKEIGEFYFDIAKKAFIPYVETYFDVRFSTKTIPNNTYPFETRQGDGLKKNEFVRNVNVSFIESLKVKSGITTIPKFEFTPYLIDNIDQAGFNFNTFVDGLVQIAAEVTPIFTGETPIPVNNDDPTQGGNGGTNTPGGTKDTPKESSIFGTAFFFLTAAGIGAYVYRDKLFGKK